MSVVSFAVIADITTSVNIRECYSLKLGRVWYFSKHSSGQRDGVSLHVLQKNIVLSLCRPVAAHHTVVELTVSAKHVKLLVQPLRVGVGVVAFARTPKSAARWSTGKISGCQTFYNGTPVSEVVWASWCCDVYEQHIAVHYCCLKQPKKQLPPPLDGLAEERVVGGVLVGNIHAVHVLVVRMYYLLASLLPQHSAGVVEGRRWQLTCW